MANVIKLRPPDVSKQPKVWNDDSPTPALLLYMENRRLLHQNSEKDVDLFVLTEKL
jgi:hypothetical protein